MWMAAWPACPCAAVCSQSDVAGVQIEAEHLPLVLASGGLGRSPPKYSPFLGFFGLARVHAGRQKDAVAPHDRRRPAAAGDVGLPGDVLGRRPVVGQFASAAKPIESAPRNCGQLSSAQDAWQAIAAHKLTIVRRERCMVITR